MARRYKLKARAKSRAATRQRIVEATIALHESVGVSRTTISAIAENAGVERATVYRHFPDERSLLEACTGHYVEENPPPNPEDFAAIADPEERLKAGLTAVYAYHRRTEAMTANAERELPNAPVLADVLSPFFEYWGRLREELTKDLLSGSDDSELVRAAIGHAMSFQTWRSLVREEGLEDDEAVRVMVAMIRTLA